MQTSQIDLLSSHNLAYKKTQVTAELLWSMTYGRLTRCISPSTAELVSVATLTLSADDLFCGRSVAEVVVVLSFNYLVIVSSRRCRRCPILKNRLTEKSPPADSLPVKIRRARRPPGRDGFLSVNCRPGRLFWGRFYNGKTYGTGDIFIKGRHIKPVIISSWADFSSGSILMRHRHARIHAFICVCLADRGRRTPHLRDARSAAAAAALLC